MRAMQKRGIQLQYSFEPSGQQGADIDNALFDLLAALQAHGSIRHAAAALNSSYRHVWGSLKHWEEVLGQPLVEWVQGKRARLTPFASRLMWAERQARTRMTPHIEALRAELEHVLAQALDGRTEVLEVFASHDLGLPLLREAAAAEQLHISLRFAGSMDALRALAQGRCNVAGFHVPQLPQGSAVFAAALKPLLKPGQHKLIGAMRRQQGLMSRPGTLSAAGAAHAPATLAQVAASGLRFVNRQEGSGTRLLMDHLLAAEGLEPAQMPGWRGSAEDSHLAVAAAIAGGQADVGPGIEAAALQFGLQFHPLVEEDYFLVCLKDSLETPAVQRLRAVMAGVAFGQALGVLPGYRLQRAGEVLSLVRALPWWRFRGGKG